MATKGTVVDHVISGWDYAVLIDEYHASDTDSFGFNEDELELIVLDP